MRTPFHVVGMFVVCSAAFMAAPVRAQEVGSIDLDAGSNGFNVVIPFNGIGLSFLTSQLNDAAPSPFAFGGALVTDAPGPGNEFTFGFSHIDGAVSLSFTTFNGLTVTNLAAIDTGWFNSFDTHTPTNTNYIAGHIGTTEFHNFYVFDGVGDGSPIVSASLTLFQSSLGGYESDDATETFAIYQYNGDANELVSNSVDDLIIPGMFEALVAEGNVVPAPALGSGLLSILALIFAGAFAGGRSRYRGISA